MIFFRPSVQHHDFGTASTDLATGYQQKCFNGWIFAVYISKVSSAGAVKELDECLHFPTDGRFEGQPYRSFW